MKRGLSLTLGLLVVLLIAGHASATLVLITLDEYGTGLRTEDGVTRPLPRGFPIAGGGIAYGWEGAWGVGGDIVTGSIVLINGDGNISDLITFDNLGPVSWYSDGTDGFDSPADMLPPLPCDPQFFCFPVGLPKGDNGTFYFAQALSGTPGSARGVDILYYFVDGRIVPEPASLVLLVSGFVVLAGMARRRHRRN